MFARNLPNVQGVLVTEVEDHERKSERSSTRDTDLMGSDSMSEPI